MFGIYLFFGMFVAVIGFVFGYFVGFNWGNLAKAFYDLSNKNPK